jgi:hypothetical protein
MMQLVVKKPLAFHYTVGIFLVEILKISFNFHQNIPAKSSRAKIFSYAIKLFLVTLLSLTDLLKDITDLIDSIGEHTAAYYCEQNTDQSFWSSYWHDIPVSNRYHSYNAPI